MGEWKKYEVGKRGEYVNAKLLPAMINPMGYISGYIDGLRGLHSDYRFTKHQSAELL